MNTKFGKLPLFILATLFIFGRTQAADLQPLPPVVISPPETQGPDVAPAQPPVFPGAPGFAGHRGSFSPISPTARPGVPSEVPSVVVTPPTVTPSIPVVVSSPVPATPQIPETTSPFAAPTIISSTPVVLPTTAPRIETEPVETAPQISQALNPVSPATIEASNKKIEEEGIYFNVADEDIREVLKQVSRALGKNFLLDDKLKGKVTIISERKMTKDEIWEAFQSSLDVLGFTIVQGPAGLLKLVATRDALSNPIDLYTDSSPYTDRFITRLITLRNISAADMSNVIKGLISKEGNLFAFPVTNTLIITDSGTNIDRLERLIKELDQEGPQEILEIIPILYADVKDLAAKITQIFETDKSGASAAAAAPRRGAKDTSSTGEIAEIPSLRKVIPDERTNSLIVLASKLAIDKVRDLIKKLDSPLAGDSGEVHVYYLKHASAKDMSTLLNTISGAVQQEKDKDGGKKTASAADTASARTAAVSSLVGGAEFTGKFTVTSDDSTNALVITANAKDYNTLLEQVIAKLDIPRRQVYVEAVIVELSVSEDRQLGTGFIAGKGFNVGGNQLSAFGSTFGFLDPARFLGGTAGAASGTTVDVPDPNNIAGGDNLSIPAFFAAVQFTQANTNINILSTPNILTLDNQEAEIKVGQKVPFQTSQTLSVAGAQQAFTREDVALSLKIKPQINDGGTVRLEVTQEDQEIIPGTGDAQIPPTTTERKIQTAIVAKNGQTLVLGGLIKDKYTTVVNKIPGLGDIPILGYLFKTRTKIKEKVNLIVFLTPHIISEPHDFLAILNRKINEQNDFVAKNFGKKEQKQIKKSLESHADYLLQASGESPETQSPAPAPQAVRGSVSEPKASPAAPLPLVPTLDSGLAPEVDLLQSAEDTDLALENEVKPKKKSSPTPKKSSPKTEKSSPSSESTPTTGDFREDIDLAH